MIADVSRIRKIDHSGIITTIAGNGNSSYASTVNGGKADTSAVGAIAGLSADTHGNIYVSDQNNYKIYKINSAGIITVIAGVSTGYTYNGDNIPAITAQIVPDRLRFNLRTGGIFFNGAGTLSRIRMIDSLGIIHTVAGNGTLSYTGDGGLADTSGVPNPGGVGFDNCGNLYIAQVGGPARIRKVTFDTTCTIHHSQAVTTIPNPTNIKFYPNPTSDLLHIEVPATMHYRLLNVVGTLIQQGTLHTGNNDITLKYLPQCMYVLEMSSADVRVVRKVLKE